MSTIMNCLIALDVVGNYIGAGRECLWIDLLGIGHYPLGDLLSLGRTITMSNLGMLLVDPEEDPEEHEDDESEDGPVDYPMDGGDDGNDGDDDDDGNSSGDDARDGDEDVELRRRGGRRALRLG
ncbi:hypothetical protein Tco_0706036 [Tanacetum coccineum]|uniref:Uncharacterized protein n=1 Tax=Tanacetum coccineum TaxID=301880 RepID=A0ABQ4Y890_9ASTR